MILSDREKNINNLLNNIKTQEEWEYDRDIRTKKLNEKYKKYLEDYKLVKDIDEFNKIKVGGYIRYIDSDDNIKWGGFLLKKYNNNNIDYMIIANSNRKILTVSLYKNLIFYKPHLTSSDKTRKLFISYLDKI